jgi:hypothetical protein
VLVFTSWIMPITAHDMNTMKQQPSIVGKLSSTQHIAMRVLYSLMVHHHVLATVYMRNTCHDHAHIALVYRID